MECAQLQITGGGNTQPSTVSFPGAYSGSDPGKIEVDPAVSLYETNKALPGIKINIYQHLSGYTIPGSPNLLPYIVI